MSLRPSASRLSVLALVTGMSACAINPTPFPPMTRLSDTPALVSHSAEEVIGDIPTNESAPLHVQVDRAVGHLVESLAVSHQLSPVLVATITDLSDLNLPRPLGQIVSEQVASGLVKRGFTVRETRLREGLALRQGLGELLLTRDLQESARSEHAAAWVVVGTYTAAKHTTWVQLRAVRLSDGVILSTADFRIANGVDIRTLLMDRQPSR